MVFRMCVLVVSWHGSAKGQTTKLEHEGPELKPLTHLEGQRKPVGEPLSNPRTINANIIPWGS